MAMGYKTKTEKQTLNYFQVNKPRIIFSVAGCISLEGEKGGKILAEEKSTRRSRVTLCLLSAHPSTPALHSPQELLCVFNNATCVCVCVCYLHMFSARQYLLHQELKQDRRDLASSSENKASSINSASKRSKHVFWRD